MIPYVYIVVRNDIKREYICVQACHAALEAGYCFNKPKITTHLVVLQVENKEQLEIVARELNKEHIDYEMFSEGWCDIGNTALATQPVVKQKEGILRMLPLLEY